MHRDDRLGFEQPASIGSLSRRHGVVIADRQHGDLRRIELADDLHIAENIGVAGVVDSHSVLELHHEATSFAAVDHLIAVGNPAGVFGVDHGHAQVANLVGASFIHAGNLLDTLFLHPIAELDHPYNSGVVFPCNGQDIANVVGMAVCAQHDVHFLKFFLGFGTLGISHDPGVDQHGRAARSFDAEGSVPEPGQLNAFEVHDFTLLKIEKF